MVVTHSIEQDDRCHLLFVIDNLVPKFCVKENTMKSWYSTQHIENAKAGMEDVECTLILYHHLSAYVMVVIVIQTLLGSLHNKLIQNIHIFILSFSSNEFKLELHLRNSTLSRWFQGIN